MNIIRKISLTVVAMMFATIANAYNFTITNVSGKQGETKTISVGLNNETTDITAFAGEFVVPTGLEFVFDEAEDEYDFTLGSRKNTTHVFSSAKQTNGNVMVSCYSTKNKCFTGTSGELFTGQLKLTGAPGTYTVKFINAYVTSDAAKDFTCADVTFTVTIDDDTPKGTYEFTIPNVSGTQNSTATVSVSLNNETTDITAFAGEFVVPTGLEFVFDEAEDEYDFTLSGRKNTTHVFSSAKQTNGNVMVTCYSTKNKCFTGTSGEIFSGQLKLTGAPGTYTVKLTNSYVTSDAAKDFPCADVTFTVTIEDAAISEANQFKTDNATVLGKSTEDITSDDLDAINKALEDYDKLSEAAKNILSSEKTLLDNLKKKAEELNTGIIASGRCGENVTYVLYNDGTLVISGSGEMENYPQYNSAPWYENKDKIIKVQIEDGVTNIGNRAFYECFSLTSITIPNSVTSIGNYAFRECSGLTSITIPNSVTSIGEGAFENCSGLTSVTIPNSVTSIGECAFWKCFGLISVTIPNSVTSIGWGAFGGCSGLTSVTIPNSVTSIGNYAFDGCSGLTSIMVEEGNPNYDCRDNCNAIIETSTNTLISGCQNTVIPNSVTSIGDNAFYRCSGLTSVTIPNSVTSIGNHAFRECSGLISVTIPNSVTSIGDNAFYDCSGLTSITIPNSVTRIDASTFSECSSLTSVTIPNSVTSIGNFAFEHCSGLTSVTIPNSVTSIGGSAFCGCKGLTSVTIPNSVTSIGNSAFNWCTGLTSVTIPNSVTSIGNYAFSYCSGLKDVYCYAETVPTTSSFAFQSSNINSTTLHVPAASLEAYKSTAPWGSFGTIVPIGMETPVSSISVTASSNELAVGEKTTLTATVLPENASEKTVTWSSSDTNVATVDAATGEVTAVGEGTATITATTTDGSGVTGSIEITVIEEAGNTDNYMGIEPMKVKSGQTISLPVTMNNQEDFIGFQCDVTLPEEFSYYKTVSGNVSVVTDKTRLVDDEEEGITWSISKKLINEKTLRVVASNNANAKIAGNEGAIFYVKVDIPEGLDGDYNIKVTNINMSNGGDVDVTLPDVDAAITLYSYTLGDINDDGRWTITDVTKTIEFVLDDGYTPAADMNSDGKVTITDVTKVIECVLDGGLPEPSGKAAVKKSQEEMIY